MLRGKVHDMCRVLEGRVNTWIIQARRRQAHRRVGSTRWRGRIAWRNRHGIGGVHHMRRIRISFGVDRRALIVVGRLGTARPLEVERLRKLIVCRLNDNALASEVGLDVVEIEVWDEFAQKREALE